MSNTFVGVLKFSNFRKIWVSQLSSQIALHMLNFAIILHIYDITQSVTSISLVLIASALPTVLLGPFTGVIADRLDYKNIIIYSNFLRFLAVLLLFFGFNNILALLEIVFLISAISQFLTPAEMSSVPLIVPKQKLIAANSVVMTTMYGALVIGYTVAGPIMSFISIEWLILICAGLYLLGTLTSISMTKYDNKKVRKLSLSTLANDLEHIWMETKEGIIHIKNDYSIYNPMIKLAIGWMMLGAIIVLIPGFGETVLDISPKFVGPAIIGPAGLGMLIGAFYLDKKKKLNFSSAINKSIFFVGVLMVLFSAYRFYDELSFARLLSIALTVAMGFGISIIYISSQTLLHLNSVQSKRGRIFGISSMLIKLALSIPALGVGGVADITSPLFAMFLVSFIILVYGTSLLFEE